MSYNNPNEKTYGYHPAQSPPQPQYAPQPGYPPQPGAHYQQQPQYQEQQPQYYPPQPQQQQPVYHQQQPAYQQQSPPPEQQQQPEVVQEQPQRQQAPMADKGNGEREWQNGMCGCFDDMSICCKGYWCPCMTYSTIQWRLRHNGDMSGYSNCNGPCIGWTALTYFGCQWVLSMIQRGDVRAKYNLSGSGCGDCSRHFWCGCCTLIQEDKESRLLASENVNNGGYQQNNGMNYAPQK